MHVLGKYECDERDVKRDERDKRDVWLHISCLYPSRASFKIFGENGLEAFVTEKLVFLIVISSLIRISMFFLIIILQVSELIY